MRKPWVYRTVAVLVFVVLVFPLTQGRVFLRIGWFHIGPVALHVIGWGFIFLVALLFERANSEKRRTREER